MADTGANGQGHWWEQLAGLTGRVQQLRESEGAALRRLDEARREAVRLADVREAAEALLRAEVLRLSSAGVVAAAAMPEAEVPPPASVPKKARRGKAKDEGEGKEIAPDASGTAGASWPLPVMDRQCTLCGIAHRGSWPACERCAGAVPVVQRVTGGPAGKLHCWRRKDGSFVALGGGAEVPVEEELSAALGCAVRVSDARDAAGMGVVLELEPVTGCGTASLFGDDEPPRPTAQSEGA